jgi:hypothetical protein
MLSPRSRLPSKGRSCEGSQAALARFSAAMASVRGVGCGVVNQTDGPQGCKLGALSCFPFDGT